MTAGAAVVVAVLCFLIIRHQTGIGDRQFLCSMIPRVFFRHELDATRGMTPYSWRKTVEPADVAPWADALAKGNSRRRFRESPY